MVVTVKNASQAVVEEIRLGHHVGVMDGDHSNPDHMKLISDPAALQRYRSAGLRDIVIESDPYMIERYSDMQQKNMSRDEVRDAIKSEQLFGMHSARAGNLAKEIENRADLVYNTGRLGISLHGVDNMSGALQDAVKSLTPEETSSLLSLHSAEAKELTATQKQAARHLTDNLLDARRSRNPNATVENDERITREVAEHAEGRPVIIMYGASHFIGGRDLNERLTANTGRQTTTIMMVNNEETQKIFDSAAAERQGAVDMPNIVYDGMTGEVRRMRASATAEGRLRAIEYGAGTHVVQSRILPDGSSTLIPRENNENNAAIPQNSCLQLGESMRGICSTSISPASNTNGVMPPPPTPMTAGSKDSQQGRPH